MTNPLASALGVGDSALVQLATGGALAVEGSSGGGGAVSALGSFLPAPPVFADWTQLNWGAGTTGNDSGIAGSPTVFLQDATPAGGGAVRGLQVARTGAVGSAYTLSADLCFLFPQNGNSANVAEAGMFVSDGTKLITHTMGLIGASGTVINEQKTFATPNTAPANLQSQNAGFATQGLFRMRITSDTVHRNYEFSWDGVNYQTRLTELIATSTLVNTETVVGFYVALNGTPVCAVTLAGWDETSP